MQFIPGKPRIMPVKSLSREGDGSCSDHDPAFVQFSASVHGTVTDPNRAVVVGVKVVLTDTDTNVSRTFVSNFASQSNFSHLAPGPYTFSVSATGFEKTIQPVIVSTDHTAGTDIRLKVGSAASSVTVTVEDQEASLNYATRNSHALDWRSLQE